MNSGIDQTVQDMLYLTVCALHSTAPEKARMAEMDMERLYRLAKAHSMTAIVCMALEAGHAFSGMEPGLAKCWQDEKNKAVRKNMLLDAEYREICDYMEANGIWYMPLKGAVLKDLYPRFGMRQMADYDILFDPAAAKHIQHYMEGRGYQAESVGKGSNDAYHKPPVYNFEMHRSLFDENHRLVWCQYYKDINQRLIPDGNGCYRFREEDFYIYITTHACKHYQGGGTGLRSLMDCYVYCRKKGGELDWDYIRGELNKLEIAEFEQDCRELAASLFSIPDYRATEKLTEAQKELLSTLTTSGTYGTMEQRVKNELRALQAEGQPLHTKTKLRYLLRRLFPDREWFRVNAPFCCQHRWAIPFYVTYRAFRGLILRRRQIIREIRAVKKAD